MNLNDLNDSQRQAVLCVDAPSLVIAGAGSGKTRVLTYKIAYLLEQGMAPYNILALTFTNKAANEMRQRISSMVDADRASKLWMGTFHSIFCRILRIESDRLGFSADFTIYDATDSKSLLKKIIAEMQLDDKKYKPSAVASYISQAKNLLIFPFAYANRSDFRRRDEAMNMPMLYKVYETYFQRCRMASAMDFDDLLLYTWSLLSQHPDVLQKYENLFHFVLVDEYQDTNFAQHQIVTLLTQRRQRVCVVGDDAQSIYSFRGAELDNILNFQTLYPGSRLFKLEQNYRSSQNIVRAANSLIDHNVNRIHKDVYSHNEEGELIRIHHTYSDTEEAYLVARDVARFASRGMAYRQMAVLYRTNAQSRVLEEVFRKLSIPYILYGGLSFYQRKEIKDVIAYFRLAVNPYDEESLRRVINYPTRGIGDTTLNKVYQRAITTGTSPWDVLQAPELLDVNKGTQTKLANFVAMIKGFHDMVSGQDAYTAGLEIVRTSGVQADIFHGHNVEDISRQENLQELLDGISSFVVEHREQGYETHLTNYLQDVSLISDLDKEDDGSDDKVTLMTVHAAKGLEFRTVFVVGMEEELFPSQMCMDSPRQLEEERRLFYVAMTRAERHLILTCAQNRMRFGKMESFRPSRFLQEIDGRYVQRDGAGGRKFSAPTQPQRIVVSPSPRFVPVRKASTTAGTADIPAVSVGVRISHERFGQGTVEAVTGTGMDTKATVRFDNVGVKQLLLRFAKIRVL